MVNPRGNDLHTAVMQSIDTMSIPQEREKEREREREREKGGGGGHLSAKSRPGKNYKISVQMMFVVH